MGHRRADALLLARRRDGAPHTPPIEYPHFIYGFFAITMAWQFAFLVIGSNPIRFRPLMVPSMFEKFSYVVTLVVCITRRGSPLPIFRRAIPDLILGILFVVAFVKTLARADSSALYFRTCRSRFRPAWLISYRLPQPRSCQD